MHVSTGLISLLATAAAAHRLETWDVPAACSQQCAPVMTATQNCDAQLLAQFGGPPPPRGPGAGRFGPRPGPGRLVRRQTTPTQTTPTPAPAPGTPVVPGTAVPPQPLPLGADPRALRRQAEVTCTCPLIATTGAPCQNCIRTNGWTGPKMDDIMGMCVGVSV